MKEVGRVTHVAKSGRVIVELASPVRDGAVLGDRRGTRIARVMETIGPVARPFASASPLTNNISPHVNGAMFALDDEREAPRGGAARRARMPGRGPQRADRRVARKAEPERRAGAGRRASSPPGRRAPERRAGAGRREVPSSRRAPERRAGSARRPASGSRRVARKAAPRRGDSARRPRHGGRDR